MSNKRAAASRSAHHHFGHSRRPADPAQRRSPMMSLVYLAPLLPLHVTGVCPTLHICISASCFNDLCCSASTDLGLRGLCTSRIGLRIGVLSHHRNNSDNSEYSVTRGFERTQSRRGQTSATSKCVPDSLLARISQECHPVPSLTMPWRSKNRHTRAQVLRHLNDPSTYRQCI